MTQSNTNTVETVETKLSAVELNSAIKQAGLWKTGCQLLSNIEKETLLTGTEKQQEEIYKILEKKNEISNSKIAEASKASFEVNEKGEIELSYNDKKDNVKIETLNDNELLQTYKRPIKEVDLTFGEGFSADGYRGIVQVHDNKLISVVRDSYKVVPNASIIDPLMEQLGKVDNKWKIDRSHSFISPERMKLQITFPELRLGEFDDEKDDIAMSLFLHNSYDGSEGVRMIWGAIRGICTNGMVFGTVASEFYGRHTKNFQIDNLKEALEESYNKIPMIRERLEELENTKVTRHMLEKKIKEVFGDRVAAYVRAVIQKDGMKAVQNQWLLYNIITYYISHAIPQHMRTAYQMKAASLFQM